jgi:hypothetical protein
MDKPLRKVDQIDAIAFLEYQKIKYVSYETSGRKINFLYEDTPEFNHTLFAFLNKTIKVDPQDYNNQVKTVVRLMREIMRKEVDHND